MRVFLTGGTGFIGSRVAKKLRDRGDEVVALVRSRSRAAVLEGIGCELADGDLNDALSIERALAGVDSVTFMAEARSPFPGYLIGADAPLPGSLHS